MKNNLKYIVYCTTCTINKKIYIGVHKTNPDVFDGYIGNGCYINNSNTYQYSKTKFQNAVKKYGPKNFIRNTIAVFETEEEAYLLESIIVNELFLQRPDVYNMVLGGKFTLPNYTKIKIYQYDSEGNFIREFESMREAALTLNRNNKTVWSAVQNRCKCCNTFLTKEKYKKLDLSKIKLYKGIEKIPVYQYDKLGEYECCYESIRDAARVLKISDANIGVAIKLGTICNNKYFSDVYSTNFSYAKTEHLKTTPVYQYDLEGNFVREFSGMPEAKKTLGITSDIYKAIRLGRTAGNYQWSFEKLEKMPKVKPKAGRARKIGKYDKNWNLVKEYNTLQECKNENGSGMVHVLNGRDLFAKGFRYKYLS